MPDGTGGAIGAGNRTIAPKARGRKPSVAWPYMRVRAENGAEPLERGRYHAPTSAELAAWVTAQAIPAISDTAWLFPSGMAAMRGALGAEVVSYQSAAEPIETVIALERVKRLPSRMRIEGDARGARVERFTKSEKTIASFSEDPRITLCNGGAWVPCGPVVNGRPMVAKTIAKGVRAYVALDSHAAYFGPELSPGTARVSPRAVIGEAPKPLCFDADTALACAAREALSGFVRLCCDAATALACAAREALSGFLRALRKGAEPSAETVIAGCAFVLARNARSSLRGAAQERRAYLAKARAAETTAAQGNVFPRASERVEGIARTYHTPVGAGRVVEPAAPTAAELRANPRLPAMAPAELRAALSPETVESTLRVDAARALNRQRTLCTIAQKRAAAIAARKAAK